MLLRAFFLIFLFSVLTVTMLATTGLYARAKAVDRALAFVPAAYQRGLATLPQAFANGAFVPPQSQAATCISNDSPCGYSSTQTITVPAQTAPLVSTACAPAAPNCARNLQKQGIDESRLGLQMAITIFDARGNPVVTRTKYMTLRTFGVAPYFALIGERDGAFGDRAVDAEGENAGAAASPMQSGTQIRVLYHDTTGANPDSEHDTYSTQGWNSGNAGSPDWSP
ncbi:MAG: hypothetical protein M3126_10865 [Candidatus Eremiobacteraeota bacterium]|nr:hypothetical protein [Candidatus Eremiobacteraeota bacterium]